MTEVRRGDIFYADLSPVIGSEQDGFRPVYLMDHNLIPHENTGNPTHRYRIKEKDAKEFKWRMEHEPSFMSEHAGNFSSKKILQRENR